jgi:hypothetical protein
MRPMHGVAASGDRRKRLGGRATKRLVAGALGAAMILFPLRLLYVSLVPVPQYQTGTAADYLYAAMAALMIYGGAALGIFVMLWLSHMRRQAVDGMRVFQVSVCGAIGTVSLVMLVWAAYRWMTLGLVTASWALAPVVAIMAGTCSAIVAAGAGLVWFGLRGSRAGA